MQQATIRRDALMGMWARVVPSGSRILPVLGGPLRGRRFCANYSLRPHYLLGHYERPVTQILRELIQPGQIAYDIGANTGYLSLVMAQLVRARGERGQVYAFEPTPSAFRLLVTNSVLNQDLPIQAFSLALSDSVGVEPFSCFEFDLVSRLGDHSEKYGDAAVIRTRVETLDHFFTEFALQPPHFLKIDVEGAELQVLRGGKALLGEYRPTVLVETHSDELDEGVLRMMRELRYDCTTVSAGMPRHLLFTPGAQGDH
ncbi:MAG TPA: FkbM family methyltransferase [Pseudoxanthomonas sp.]|nr:FkbM family methyltransferase [Pseudoxanthomonas sp.]